MHLFPRARLVVLIALAAVFGSILSTAAQQQEINVNVIGCVDPDCVDTVNIFTMDGATVSSYDAAGALIDSCTVSSAPDGFDGCQLAATNDATFAITPSAEYAGYVLLSDAPAIFESPDRGVWVWYFVPPAEAPAPEAPAETVRANVILCVDPDCADTVNSETMVGATVTSYAPDGSLVDSCTVSLTQSEMVDCTIMPPPDRGSWDIQPAEQYKGYRLMSLQPEVIESEMHGPVYLWYFAPEKDNALPPPTQAPAAPAPVTGLPSTGVGAIASPHLAAVYAVIPFILAAAAVAANRIDRR